MSILSFNVGVTGLVGDAVNPRLNTMVTTDNLATITTAGYLNNQNVNGNPILPTDVFHVQYSFNQTTQTGTFGIFVVSYAAATGYSLVAWANPGDVLLPVVNGDFANFNGTTGQIKDAGYSPSNAAKTVVAMMNGAVTLNHVAQFADTAGTLKDGGVLGTAAAKAASDNTKATLASINGSTTVNHVAQFSDTAGTIQDGGVLGTAAAKAASDNTKGTLASVTAATTSGHLAQFNDIAGTVGDSGVTTTSISTAITQLGQLFQVSVTLNPTQMAAAFATPAQLIANPAASQLIIVHSATVYVASTGNTPYATGTAPIIQYSSGGTNGQNGAGTIATASGLVAGDITAATSQVRTLLQAATAAVTGLSGLGIYFSNATGAYTAGTGTNVTFTLVYELLTATV